ncbi:hypothetical protein [Flavobacterium yafengii]|uniref:hypothetical protein n=1 Tax=Flavobacterium yafengii TaxID=3041253 RepID=UPI0031F5F137
MTTPQLYKWRKEFEELGEGSFPGKGNLKLTSEQEKIHELEKRLKDTELERDILKKAIDIFFQERSMIYSFIKNNEQLFPIEKNVQSSTSEQWKLLPMEKTNNHCKTATKNYHKRTGNIDLS